MPCYGHSHCALCNVPVCPDCVGSYYDSDEENIDETKLALKIDVTEKPYKWLTNSVAIYENNEVYNVKEYEEGILGVLCDKDDENRKHSNYANVKAAMFCMRIVGIF